MRYTRESLKKIKKKKKFLKNYFIYINIDYYNNYNFIVLILILIFFLFPVYTAHGFRPQHFHIGVYCLCWTALTSVQHWPIGMHIIAE